ncbi:MAG TPA: protein kinase [Kofleriaceae bacterium]
MPPPGDDRETGELETLLSATSAAPVERGTATSPPTLVGGRYQILSLAGSGSMGSVYRARDTELDEDVALKFLRSDLVHAPEMLERFRREVRLARRVAHRHVARVYDIGEHGGDKFLTMAFIEGEPLRALLVRSRPLPVGRALAIARAVCEGLVAAHAVGVIHRDLKPDNVMLASDGGLAITDFGIARSASVTDAAPTATLGTAIGTPAYMAPEQVEGASDIDERADLYAFGVMLFEMLTGELPFSGGSAIAIAAARLDRAPPDPRDLRASLDPALAALVLRCMARQPGDRFASASEVEAALARITASDTSPPSRAAAAPPARAPALATAASDKTVAVLPFRNAGGDDEGYLADGLTEDLIDTLSTARGLRVRPRSSTLRFAASDLDARAVGRELDVQVIVDGSVRRRGEMLRITARLVSVAEGFQLWARRFDRPAGDALMVSDEVADAVAQALTVAPAGLNRKAPTDAAAIDLYLRGRAELRDLGAEAMERAVALLEEAEARAPGDPTLLSALARAHARSFFFRTDTSSIERALALAERANAAAPGHAEALLALGQVRFARGDYLAAAAHVREALGRAPYLAEAHELLGRIRLEVGPLDDGIAAMERALTLDPLLLTARLELARGLGLRGDFAAARQLVVTAPEGDRAARGPFVARLLGWSRDPASWLDLMPPSSAVPGTGPLIESAVNMIMSGQIDPAVQDQFVALARSDRPARFRVLMLQLAAEFSAYAGEPVAALDRVSEAIDSGLIDLMWLDRCPHLFGARRDPRFGDLRGRLDRMAAPIRATLDAA